MKPSLTAEWDLSSVLMQLRQMNDDAQAPEYQRKSTFTENPKVSDCREYYLGITHHPPPSHLEFRCGQFIVSNDGIGLRYTPEELIAADSALPQLQLPEHWWCSSNSAVEAIKKVSRMELEERLKNEKAKDEPKRFGAQAGSSAQDAQENTTLASGNMTLGEFEPPSSVLSSRCDAHSITIHFCSCWKTT
jgi:hypothetical protein